MIPQSHIMEWSQQVPWQSNEQVEQDLIICRALVEIFSDKWLASSLAFRGGTALHKLYLQPQPRYSEDIDLVQVRAEPIKETVQRLQVALAFMGESSVKPRRDGTQIICRFDSEFPPSFRLRLKVEINTREHFTMHGLVQFPFEVKSSWFDGGCNLTQKPALDIEALMLSYKKYMNYSVEKPPTQQDFLLNMEAKIHDSEFLGDTTALLRPDVPYNPITAYELVKTTLIAKI